MVDKNSIRSQMKETLSAISKPFYEDYSYKIASQLFMDENWKKAQVIGITVSKPPEVDTYQIIRAAWELGKQVVVPKCYPREKKLSFRRLEEFAQLESVFYGLLEPKIDVTEEVSRDQIDLLIVPGLAFTKAGYRLGFGGGYFDRFLKGFSGNTLSLAFSEQMISEFPIEDHDVPVSKIITNDGVIYT